MDYDSMSHAELIDELIKLRRQEAAVSHRAGRLYEETMALISQILAAIDRGWPRQGAEKKDGRAMTCEDVGCRCADTPDAETKALADKLGAALYGVEKFTSNAHWIAAVERVLRENGWAPRQAPLSPESAAKLDAGIADAKAGRIGPELCPGSGTCPPSRQGHGYTTGTHFDPAPCGVCGQTVMVGMDAMCTAHLFRSPSSPAMLTVLDDERTAERIADEVERLWPTTNGLLPTRESMMLSRAAAMAKAKGILKALRALSVGGGK